MIDSLKLNASKWCIACKGEGWCNAHREDYGEYYYYRTKCFKCHGLGYLVEPDMITFLPYEDFTKCARCLDRQRLGKQRIEALMIMRALTGQHTGGWTNHPAVRMWRGHLNLLIKYYHEMVKEWILRGYEDNGPFPITMPKKYAEPYAYLDGGYRGIWPIWLGMPELHASHRAALLEKLPEHYNQFNWKEEPKIEYFWPI